MHHKKAMAHLEKAQHHMSKMGDGEQKKEHPKKEHHHKKEHHKKAHKK